GGAGGGGGWWGAAAGGWAGGAGGAPGAPGGGAGGGAPPPVLTAGCLGALADLGGGSPILLADRLGEMIVDYTRTRPLLVILDDMQWADDLTAFALRALVPALAGEPVLWLVAPRPLPAPPPPPP